MKVHFIAIGGSIMHALACDMKRQGHFVTGSDDEIYEPSKTQLASYHILPAKMGWDDARITANIDIVVLGMHAKANNPELLMAQALDLKIYSFPEFVALMSTDKKRVVVAGSHGKTTTTSMIMHALKENGQHFDYLVGARLRGFENMVQLSDAPIIVIEGDEYLSSAIDRRPKFIHYQPDITIITGVEWDHMNVFPTEENYVKQFEQYVSDLEKGTTLYYDEADERLVSIVEKFGRHTESETYHGFKVYHQKNGVMLAFEGRRFQVKIFGRHNMANMHAAMKVCNKLGISNFDFLDSMKSFGGAAKRQQYLIDDETQSVILDFAHAPSKVKATVAAIREKYPDRKMVACLELHTYSSLNTGYLPMYEGCFGETDSAFVFYDRHTLKIKHLPMLSEEHVKTSFGGEVNVYTEIQAFKEAVKKEVTNPIVILLMTSGNFASASMKDWAVELLS